MEMPIRKRYMIFELIRAVSRDSNPYLRMILSDNGALINAVMFDPKLPFEPRKGDMVEITAVLQNFNNKPQLKVSDMSFIAAASVDAFLPKSKHEPQAMIAELKRLVESNVKDTHLAQLYRLFFEDSGLWEPFQVMPAAKTVHHAYIYGLLEHTLGVVRLAVKITPLYPTLNGELVILGALFHDVGKVYELTADPGFDYTLAGNLLGHLVIGGGILNDYISKIEGFPEELKIHILHLMASHHGELAFGSPQVPKTAEAILLHAIDDLDGKLGALAAVISRDGVAPGSWSNYDRILERQIYLPKG
ncbi:MAG: HD domain-containing protein [Deferribacteraceae bacterium]|jgi:3'-5' exoribonuclease|nr:HD domain-containing protein [Deferribacteraceae bacterium]